MLLATEVSRADVLRIWQQLEDADAVEGLGGLLDVLGEVTGLGLRSLPDFAMSIVDQQGLHVAVRGRFDVQVVASDDGSSTLRGAEVSTWVERNFDAATVAAVVLGPGPDGDGGLPLVAGVVPAAGLRLTLVAAGQVAEAPTTGDSGQETLVDADMGPVVELAAEPVMVADVEPVVAVVVEALATTESSESPAPPSQPAVVEEPPEPPEPPVSSRFSSLLSPHTVMHAIEEAAVRLDDGPRDEHPVAPAAPAPQHVLETVEPESAQEPAVEALPEALVEEVAEPSARVVPAAGAAADFISGVPSPGGPREEPTPVPSVELEGAAQGNVEPADLEPGDLEHHDGHTVFEAPESTVLDAFVVQAAAGTGEPTVLGVHCPAGHGNPTHRTECRVCGEPLHAESVRMPRPGLGWLHTSAGESIELLQNVLAGRDPRASRIQGSVMPRLLPLPHGHVSGTHLEIRLEGWSVLVADLRSTNGTFLQRSGQPTLRISETPQLLMSGDVVQLGHGVDLRFEELP